MKNTYEIRGEITAIFISSPKFGYFETLIDTNDLEYVQEYQGNWGVIYEPGMKQYYVVGYGTIDGKQKQILLNRFLMNYPKGLLVDHINNDTLDNRRSSNLRAITNAENMQNRKGAQTNSKSGIRGVCWHKKKKKWMVQVAINGKTNYLGYFDNIEKAKEVAEEARAKHHPFSKEAM